MNKLFLSPFEISKAISNIGEKKATESMFELFIFAILAGILRVLSLVQISVGARLVWSI